MSNPQEAASRTPSFVDQTIHKTQEWTRGDSNSQPPACRAGALAVALRVHDGAENRTPDAEAGQPDPFAASHIARFFIRVAELPDGCWLWTGSCDRVGYGMFGAAKRHFRAHRYSYELLIGDIPVGLEMDHLCRMRECVNPFHVEPVTMQENRRRTGVRYKRDPSTFLYFVGDGGVGGKGNPSALAAWRKQRGYGDKVQCLRGHKKTVTTSGRSYCRECDARAHKAFHLRRKQKQASA